MTLDPKLVAGRLREGATLFRPMDADRARAAMEGRLPSDGATAQPRTFDEQVADRLAVLRALNRRRDVLRAAVEGMPD